jgi:hypothetical protein
VRRRVLAEVGRIEGAWQRAPAGVRRAVLAVLARRVVIHAEWVEIEWRSLEDLCAEATGTGILISPTDDEPPPAPVDRPRRGRR